MHEITYILDFVTSHLQFFIKYVRNSIGRGKIIVEFFSADMVLRVCRYRSWSADEDKLMMSEASLSAWAAFCSPSAAITCGTIIHSLGHNHHSHSLICSLMYGDVGRHLVTRSWLDVLNRLGILASGFGPRGHSETVFGGLGLDIESRSLALQKKIMKFLRKVSLFLIHMIMV